MIDDVLDEAINDIVSGAAVCFVGSGFSKGATDAEGLDVPDVAELCREICAFPGLEGEVGAPLTDLAEYCEKSNHLRNSLTSLLLKRLTLCQRIECAKEDHGNAVAGSIYNKL